MITTETAVTYLKHPSQYRTDSLKELIGPMLVGYCKSGQVVNYEKLIDALRAQGVFKITQADDGMWGYPIYTVSKKKLHAAIRRVFNKCLVKQIKQSKMPLPEFKWDPSIEDFTRENLHVVETGENEIKLNGPQS